jgi:hypothetical protein
MQNRSIVDIIKSADSAEDFDRLYIHTAAINLMNAAVEKLGGRKHWIGSDTQKLVAIMNILEDVHPLKRNVPKGDGPISEFAPPRTGLVGRPAPFPPARPRVPVPASIAPAPDTREGESLASALLRDLDSSLNGMHDDEQELAKLSGR